MVASRRESRSRHRVIASEEPSDQPVEVKLRVAQVEDIEELETLIADSARTHCALDYSAAQIERALGTAWAVDSQLIDDGTYFVVETQRPTSTIIACGGWSARATLFGGDRVEQRDQRELDTKHDAARIRAFFVHPSWGRYGLGSWLLQECENAARLAGFSRFDLVATLTGERLYRRYGYMPAEAIEHSLDDGTHGDGLTIRFVPMTKREVAASSETT